MNDEQIGIFEEGQRRRQYYSAQNTALKRRIVGGGPTLRGSTARSTNPFDIPARVPIPAKPPFWPLHAESRLRRRMRLGTLRDDLDVNPLQIVQAVCAVTHLTASGLLRQDRTQRVSWARQVAIYFVARYCSELSLPQIAFIFSQHHTSILYAIRMVPRHIDQENEAVRAMVDKVEALLRTAPR